MDSKALICVIALAGCSVAKQLVNVVPIPATIAYAAPIGPQWPSLNLTWDYPEIDWPYTIFEFVSWTNLSTPWQFYRNVTGTNVITIPIDKQQEFFTIRRAISTINTNDYWLNKDL